MTTFQVTRTSLSFAKDVWSYDYWTIEIDSLEELLGFAERNKGEIIVRAGGEPPGLEIYDDFRE
jgi:hypothetical protein